MNSLIVFVKMASWKRDALGIAQGEMLEPKGVTANGCIRVIPVKPGRPKIAKEHLPTQNGRAYTLNTANRRSGLGVGFLHEEALADFEEASMQDEESEHRPASSCGDAMYADKSDTSGSELWEHCKNADHDGYFEIHRAAAAGDVGLVRTILNAGERLAFANGEEKQGFLANVEQVCLDARGPSALGDFDSQSYRVAVNVTPLDLAAFYGHVGVIRVLLTAGVHPSTILVASSSSKLAGTASPLYLALQEGHDDVVLLLLEEFGNCNTEWLFGSFTFASFHPNQSSSIVRCLQHFVPTVFDNRRQHWCEMQEQYSPLMAVNSRSLDMILRTETLRELLADDFEGMAQALSIHVVAAAIARLIGLRQVENVRPLHLDNALRRIPRLLYALGEHGCIWEDEMLEVFLTAHLEPHVLSRDNSLNHANDEGLFGYLLPQDLRKILEAFAMFGVCPTSYICNQLLLQAARSYSKSKTVDQCRECVQLVKTIVKVSQKTPDTAGILERAQVLFQKQSGRYDSESPDTKLQERLRSIDQMTGEVVEFLQSYLQTIASAPDANDKDGSFAGRKTNTLTSMLAGSALQGRFRRGRPRMALVDPYISVRQRIVEPLLRLFPWLDQDRVLLYLRDTSTIPFLTLPSVEIVRELAIGTDDRLVHVPKNSQRLHRPSGSSNT